MIISGGVNIYPREIEDALILHPSVEDVAVFGVPTADFGEEVKAVQPVASVHQDDELAMSLLPKPTSQPIKFRALSILLTNCQDYPPASFTSDCSKTSTGQRNLKAQHLLGCGRSR